MICNVGHRAGLGASILLRAGYQTVYNVLGQQVATLADGEFPAGAHRVQWQGTDQVGQAVASGIYLYRLQAGGETKTRKMMLLK